MVSLLDSAWWQWTIRLKPGRFARRPYHTRRFVKQIRSLYEYVYPGCNSRLSDLCCELRDRQVPASSRDTGAGDLCFFHQHAELVCVIARPLRLFPAGELGYWLGAAVGRLFFWGAYRFFRRSQASRRFGRAALRRRGRAAADSLYEFFSFIRALVSQRLSRSRLVDCRELSYRLGGEQEARRGRLDCACHSGFSAVRKLFHAREDRVPGSAWRFCSWAHLVSRWRFLGCALDPAPSNVAKKNLQHQPGNRPAIAGIIFSWASASLGRRNRPKLRVVARQRHHGQCASGNPVCFSFCAHEFPIKKIPKDTF